MRTRTSILVAAVTAAVLAGGVSPATAGIGASSGGESGCWADARGPAGGGTRHASAGASRSPGARPDQSPARTATWAGATSEPASALTVGRCASRTSPVARACATGPIISSSWPSAVAAGPSAEARSFVLARRQNGLVRLRLRRGAVTSLGMPDTTGAPGLAPEHSASPGKSKGVSP